MEKILGSSLVRIYNHNEKIVGIGFLIRQNQIITCSHTVNTALGHSNDRLEKPFELIKVDFPFLEKHFQVPARVVEWYPKKANDPGDIAVLDLLGDKPSGTKPTKLKIFDNYDGHRFSAYGCPQSFQEDGRWVEGKLQKFLPNGRIQAVGISDLGYFIEPGFSGGPIWDYDIEGVIGIVMSVDNAKGILQASILPSNSIVKLSPKLPLEGPIFLTYSQVDGSQFARRLQKDIQNHFEIMMETKQTSTDLIWDDIDCLKDIEKAKAIIVILTPGAIDSKRFESELIHAINLNKPIIPVLASECSIPRELAMLNYLDFSKDLDYNRQINDLLNQLKNLDEFERVEKLESLIGTKVIRSKHYPVVVGQRLITTVDYFQDREDELNNVRELMSARGTRIISIIGSAGMGKTALVSKFLFNLEHNLRSDDLDGTVDGILYLSHRTVGITLERLFLDSANMFSDNHRKALLSAWINPKINLNDKIRLLLDKLNEGTYIILLDNIEDLLDQNGNITNSDIDAFLQMSLTIPGNVRLLITSREPIKFKAKDAPLDKVVILNRGLETSYGIAMLRQADPSGYYGLKDAEDSKLAKIVEMLHGVPRALEVFVGIVKDEASALLTLDEVMDQFFDHPMTEKELIVEGYRRLDTHSKKILEGLAIFNRPVPIAAVNFLLSPYIPDIDIRSIVLRLIRIHMITVVDKNRKLISLHPMDRDFAYSQIPKQ